MKDFLKEGFLHFCILFLAIVATCACYLVATVLMILWERVYDRWWYIFQMYGYHLLGFVVGILCFYISFYRKLRAIANDRPE